MRAVTQERRSAAQPPNHPSGQTIDGGGTWNEGRPVLTPQAPPDKRGSPVPTISSKSEGGEIPVSPVSLPNKRGGSGPPAALLGPGAKDAESGAAGREGGPHDPCAKPSEKHPDGSRQEREAEPPPGSQHEVVCRRGEVHSRARGRDETREVPSAAAPDGAFTVHTGEPAKSPPQGPAGASSGLLQKSIGHGTAHLSVGSCAPEGPSMTVRAPAHPALAAAPRSRPPPSVPAFGARATLPSTSRDDDDTRASRGLSISQVHLSGPMLHAGPRLPRPDPHARAPAGSSAEGPTADGSSATASPSGDGGGAGAAAGGLFTVMGAQQAAASARGGGGDGGLTAVQQYGSNLNKRVEIRNGIENSRAKQVKIERALKLADKKGSRTKKEDDEFYALVAELRMGDARGMATLLAAEKAREKGFQRDDAVVAAENQKLDKKLTANEKARALEEAKKETARLLKSLKKQQRKEARPDYRATQRARTRRADHKRAKSLDKARKLLKAAKNPSLSKSAREKAVEKAKKASQKAKEEGRAKLDAMKKAGASKEEIKAEEKRQAEENAALDREIEEAEAKIDNGVRSEPQPDPCSLPCECTIGDCDPPDWCICFRRQTPSGGPTPPEPQPPGDGGGGGADDPGRPEAQTPGGSSVAEVTNDGGDGKDGNERGASGKQRGGSRSSVQPYAGASQFPGGAYFQQGGTDGGGGAGGRPNPPKDGGFSTGPTTGAPSEGEPGYHAVVLRTRKDIERLAKEFECELAKFEKAHPERKDEFLFLKIQLCILDELAHESNPCGKQPDGDDDAERIDWLSRVLDVFMDSLINHMAGVRFPLDKWQQADHRMREAEGRGDLKTALQHQDEKRKMMEDLFDGKYAADAWSHLDEYKRSQGARLTSRGLPGQPNDEEMTALAMAMVHIHVDLKMALTTQGAGLDADWACIGDIVQKCQRKHSRFPESAQELGEYTQRGLDIGKARDQMREGVIADRGNRGDDARSHPFRGIRNRSGERRPRDCDEKAKPQPAGSSK